MTCAKTGGAQSQEAVIGLFKFVGGLIGGGKVKRASRRAEAARIEAINKGIAESARQFDVTQANLASEQRLGEDAIGGFRGLVGLDGAEAQQAAIDQVRASPLYTSIFNNGRDAILATASATGGMRGGNTIDDLSRMGADTLAQTIQNQLGNYSGAIGVGTGADVNLGIFGENAVNSQNNLRIGGAEARANGLLMRAGVNAQNWQNFGALADNAIMGAMGIPGGGGGGGGFNLGRLLKGLF